MFDTIIKSGRVFDGAGSPWFRADVGICGGKIVEIGRVRGETNRVIDASKLCVCPGFIDTHTHSDVMVFVNPQADNVVLQGVTTQMMGNCGMSAAPLGGKTMHPEGFIFVKQVQEYGITVDWRSFSEYLSKIERQGTAINLASLVGHGTVRQAVVGNSARAVTPDELEEMKRLIAESMEAGAYGLSVGLEYVPGKWASTEELIECAKIVAQYDGIYASHSRNRDAKAHLAVAEAINIGEKARVPVLISHLTERFPAPDGGVRRGLAVMEAARERGVDVAADEEIPPFLDGYAWSTGTLVEELHLVEGGATRLELLESPEMREKLWIHLITTQYGPIYTLRGGVWDRVVLLYSKASPELIGMNFEEIAKSMGKVPGINDQTLDRGREVFHAALDLLLKEGDPGWKDVYVRCGRSTEEDKVLCYRHPLSCFATDSRISAGKTYTRNKEWRPVRGAEKSPRAFISYPQIFRMHREGRINLPLQEVIRKMTGQPSQRLRLYDRGLIRPGFFADVVVFDPQKVIDKATHTMPFEEPEGISYVLVNGELVVEKGQTTGSLPGAVLRFK